MDQQENTSLTHAIIDDRLERQPCGKAHVPFAYADRVCNISKVGIVNVTLRIAIIRVIEQVEDLGPDLDLNILDNVNCPEYSHISIEKRRSPKRVSPHRTEFGARFRMSPSR